MQNNYLDKDISYFVNPRLDIISLLPNNPNQKILEVGMGGGDTLVHIKKQKLAAEVVGIDLVKLPNTNQENKVIDRTCFIDLEKDELDLPLEYFDVIIAGDVFEHLVDPWKVLKKLTQVLKTGGHIIISLPNVRDIQAIYSIIFKGSFAYAKHGIFDLTHMRFFCKIDMQMLVASAENLKTVKMIPIHELGGGSYKRKIFNRFTMRIFEQFVTSQYLIDAIKI